jgi:NitT/TauT family transport system substrate-binding protein
LTAVDAYVGFDYVLAATEPPPETTRIRFQWARSPCWVPQIVAEPLLREEGFTDIQYIKFKNHYEADKLMAAGEIDMTKYSPNEIIAQNTDWSFLKSMKDEFGLAWA